MSLPDVLYSVAQVRAFEARIIAAGTPGFTLMTRAATAALRVLQGQWPSAARVVVVCGGGNNGGDGYVLAQLAQRAGLQVTVLAASDPLALAADARRAWQLAVDAGVPVRGFDGSALTAADVVVDALLGSGTRLPLRPVTAAQVQAINAAARPVLALDLPSGLDADSGNADGVVQATVTVCFVALKTGLALGQGPGCAGRLVVDDLGVQIDAQPARLRRLVAADLYAAVPARPRQAHKGQFGSVLVIGGGAGMPGAVRLAAESALRVGAGRVTVASLPAHLAPVVGARPELMFHAVTVADDLAPVLAQADVVAVGPGLGTSAWGQAVLQAVLAAPPPPGGLVVDADALNLLAVAQVPLHRDDWILTPHPGEAARLLGCDTATVQADRLAAVDRLRQQRGGVVVLKGAGTLVAVPGEVTTLCDRGNPGMAIPGMGDVLTGAVAGLLAQCRQRSVAARAAVLAHALAGDRAAAGGQRGLLAGDIAALLPSVVNR